MSRKSLQRKVIDSYYPTTSSPLRRSINAQKIIPQVLVENDDEAERSALQRKSIINNRKSCSTSSANKRHSLSLSYLSQIPEPQLTEHISHCIKLNIENKINVKNAFSLEMIDFMTFMITKHNSENIDLQLAGTSLDAMTKIYAYRVDGLYMEILKMAGAFDKQQKTDIIQSNEQENEENQSKSPVKKKRKKNNQNIISTKSALKGCVEIIYPSQSIIGSGDLYTSDMLYQVVLSNHANSGFYHHPYNDVILDFLTESTTHSKNCSKYNISAVEDCSHLEICSSFSNFKFLNWSHENEPETGSEEVMQENDANRFQFDLDISSTEKDTFESRCYFDINEDENANLCARNAQQASNIVDLRDIMSKQIACSSKQSEYSFIQSGIIHWAGPSYWKIKTLSKPSSISKVIETCHQAALNKKKEIVLNYDDEIRHTVTEQFLHGTAIKIHAKTAKVKWKKQKITLPEDAHYDISQLYKLHIYPSINMTCNINKDQLNLSQSFEDENYNYNNEREEAEQFPTVDTDDQIMLEKDDFNEFRNDGSNLVESQKQLTGDNLVTMPKLTQKTFLQYALRPKKIDMYQLKQTIWQSLILQGDKRSGEERMDIQDEVQMKNRKDMTESKAFSLVYKSLPNKLSEANAKALSLPIAFVSLLHLANEKSLKLSSLSDFSDVIIEKD